MTNSLATKTFYFKTIYQSSRSQARVGKIVTPHGEIDTPGFVAVGTNGVIKGLDSAQLAQTGLQLIFCNTYHLLLQPGPEVVAAAGGLHRFMNRPFPLITDSGGFQVFSLAYGGVTKELKSQGARQSNNGVVKINDEGVTFRSYRDGRLIHLTPERSVSVQKALGADIIIPLDELPPYHIDPDALERSLCRTHEWEKRSLDTHLQNPHNQAMYGVLHGGTFLHLRERSAKFLTDLPFDGFAIGGSVGKNREELVDLIRTTRPLLPDTHPNHLLGIADLRSIDRLVPLGIDTFDSCYPSRAARHGLILSNRGEIKIKQRRYATAYEPIDPDCPCGTCKHHTLAYLHHLFKAKELTAYSLSTLHNLTFMSERMKAYRASILNDEI